MRRRLFLSSRVFGVLAVVVAVVMATTGPSAVAGPAALRAPAASAAAQAPSAAGAVVPLTTPARIADSRTNLQITGVVPALGTAAVQVTGRGGVPGGGVGAVVLNVTVVSPQTAGYITVWPSGVGLTNTSNLNFQAWQNIPNTVIVGVGPDGKIQLFNGSWGTVHLIVDVTGYTLTGSDATQPNLVALQVAADSVFVPSTENSVAAGATHTGFRNWYSFLSNRSTATVSNASISVMSGYSPSLFDSVTEFPSTSTQSCLAGGETYSGGALRPRYGLPPDELAVEYSLGYDSSRTIDPSIIPVGGTLQTVAITVTPADPRYARSGDGFVWFNIHLDSNVPGVSVTSTIDPTNLDENEILQIPTSSIGLIQWQLGMPQLDKRYTFTAVLHVPNATGAPLGFQPTVSIGGERQTFVDCGSCAGPAVTVKDPTLDGRTPGSGAVTFSIAEANAAWTTSHSDTFSVFYQGSPPAGG